MSSGITVRRAHLADYLELGPAFAALSRQAREPNPHMAPAAVAAALRLVSEESIVLLCAWYSEALGSDRLVGVWALRRQRDWRSGFATVLSAPLLPLYEVSSLPVVEHDRGDDVIRAILRHILASADLPDTLLLPLLPLEGPVHLALDTALQTVGSRVWTAERWSRPVMTPQPGDDAPRYLRRALGASFKKRMQQYRALGRAGAVSLDRARGPAALAAFERFLTLEAAGWKGQAGTAIACLPEDAGYFRDLAARFAAEDALQIDALTLDGATIAMGLLIEVGGTRSFLKIAYDETQSRHSPGRNLTIAMIEADFAGRPPEFFDSGAGDGVDPGSYVWGERRTMANAVLMLGGEQALRTRVAMKLRMALRRLRTGLSRGRAPTAPSDRPPA